MVQDPGGDPLVGRGRPNGCEPDVRPLGRARRGVGARLRTRWFPGEQRDQGREVRDERGV
jgi:hypothetical protein